MSIFGDSSSSELAENASKSTVKVDKVTHEWTIDNFDFCEARGSDLKSPEFSSYKYGGAKWYMKLKPNGETDAKDTISLYFHLSEESEHRRVFARFSAYILDVDQEVEVSMTSAEVRKFIADGSNSWGWKVFCKKDRTFRELLSDNVLKITCEIFFSTDINVIEHKRYCNTPYLMSSHADRDVTDNLETLLETQLLADVVISVNGKDLQAHKAILAARSKVFAAMFQHDTKESQLNRVEIEDMSEEMVSEMLRFIYTGRCENLDELAAGLLVAADKYDLDLLKTYCCSTLSANLTVENAAQNLILADMHVAEKLKNEVMKFIVTEPTNVFNSAGWKSVETNPLLVQEVLRAIAGELEKRNVSDCAGTDY